MARVEGHLGVRGFVHLKKNTMHLIIEQNPRGFSPAVLHVILTASLEVGLLCFINEDMLPALVHTAVYGKARISTWEL